MPLDNTTKMSYNDFGKSIFVVCRESVSAMNHSDLEKQLIHYLRSWKRHNIYFGLESGRRWIKEIGNVFPAACCSLSADWRAEENLPLLSLKAASEALYYRFPYNYPDIAKRGLVNANFLDSRILLKEHVFAVLHNQLVTAQHVVFSIPHVASTERLRSSSFVKKLGVFLDSLPQSYRYAVQVANQEFLTPAYFDCLTERHVAYVLSDTDDMPSLLDQVQSPFTFTSDSVLITTTVSSSLEWQLGVVETVRRCVREKRQLYCYVADVAEPELFTSLLTIMEMMNADLAKLSPIKQRAA